MTSKNSQLFQTSQTPQSSQSSQSSNSKEANKNKFPYLAYKQEENKTLIKHFDKLEYISPLPFRLGRSIRNIDNQEEYKIHMLSNNSKYLFALEFEHAIHLYVYKELDDIYIIYQNGFNLGSFYGLIAVALVYGDATKTLEEKNKEFVSKMYDNLHSMPLKKCKDTEQLYSIRYNLINYLYKITSFDDENQLWKYLTKEFHLNQSKDIFSEDNILDLPKFYDVDVKEQKNRQNIKKNEKIDETVETKDVKSMKNVEETKLKTKSNNDLVKKEQLDKMPVELKVSFVEAKDIYNKNKDFLDDNDNTLIKAFKRGKIWSAGYYGPSGTGKTTKLISIAGALGLPYLKVTGSRNIDEAYLFGKYVLKNGSTVFEYGPLTKAMKYGAMFIFDEINMIDGDVLASLNDLLDGSRMKVLDNGEVIKAHPNFRFAESMNIGYAGTNDMNISHKSRIQFKNKLSEISCETMANIVVKETGINEKTAYKMASLVPTFNDIITNLGDATSQRIDIRHIINWANLSIDLDNDIVAASILTVVSSLTEDDEDVANTTKEYLEKSDSIGSEVYKVIKTVFSN